MALAETPPVIVRGKHYEVVVEFWEEHVVFAVHPIWDSAWRHSLDITLRYDNLKEELDEKLRDLLHVLAKARKAIEGMLGSTAIDRTQSNSIDMDKSESSEIDSDEER